MIDYDGNLVPDCHNESTAFYISCLVELVQYPDVSNHDLEQNETVALISTATQRRLPHHTWQRVCT